MSTYDINVVRDGRWWMIEIPALDGLTQSRRLADVEQVAREYVAVTLDLPLSTVSVATTHIRVGGKGKSRDVAVAMGQIDELRSELRRTEQRVAALMRATATELSEADVPVRDIGRILGVSHQRASQLVAHG